MKIYHCVESYFPAVGGMQEVVKQLSERMAKLGHEVYVLTRFHPDRNFETLAGVNVVQFDIQGNPKKAETAIERSYVDYLLNIRGDVVTFFAAQQWATDLALPVLAQIKAKKVSVPTGYSGLYWPDFKQYFEDMKTHIHGYDMNVYLSNDYRDINFARENKVKHMTLIPNGAAEDEFLPENNINVRRELNIPANHYLVLLVGSYTTWKGHKEAIEIFLRSTVKDATLLMIGNNFQAHKFEWFRHLRLAFAYYKGKWSGRKRIIFNYFSRAFTVAAYKQSDLFLFPSNIECSPIVLFECAAARLPFLASDAGNSIEISKWTGGGEILPTEKDQNGFSHVKINESVKLFERIYHDEIGRKQMAERSFEEWKKRFSWEVITKQYETLYKKLLNEK